MKKPGSGQVELDFNTVERSIRPIALNFKNALFTGSDEGGDHWAVIASLVETAKLNDVNPKDWLADTLSQLAAGHPRPPSTRSCPGTTPARWPENSAYDTVGEGRMAVVTQTFARQLADC